MIIFIAFLKFDLKESTKIVTRSIIKIKRRFIILRYCVNREDIMRVLLSKDTVM